MLRNFIILVALGTCAFTAKADDEWRVRMRSLAGAFYQLFPFIADDSSPAPADLEDQVKAISALSTGVEQHLNESSKRPHVDPSLQYVAHLFRMNVNSARQSLEAGNTEYARRSLRASLSYCIACHTSGEAGPVFPALMGNQSEFANASWIRKIELASALGQFDTVLASVMNALSELPTGASMADLERGVRVALAATVRAQQSLGSARQLVESVLSSPVADRFLKESASGWKEDLNKIEAMKRGDPLQQARELIGAPAEDGSLALFRRHEIIYLASSRLVHEYLRANPDGPDKAEAFYLLGMSYDGLRDIGLWSLHEFYYESCIRRAPHTSTAAKCFARYERAVLEGQGRPHSRPAFVDVHLDELRALASF